MVAELYPGNISCVTKRVRLLLNIVLPAVPTLWHGEYNFHVVKSIGCCEQGWKGDGNEKASASSTAWLKKGLEHPHEGNKSLLA